MRKFWKATAFFCFLASLLVLTIGAMAAVSLPYEWKITENNPVINFSSSFPLSAQINCDKESVQADSGSYPQDYRAQVKLMNIIPIKNLKVKLVTERAVIPCGTPFGIKIFTEGVVVISTSDIKTETGTVNPSKIAGLKRGDVILEINKNKINSNEDIANVIEKSAGQPLIVQVRRNNLIFNTKLCPCKSLDDNFYRAGIWVRDSSAGIGTMTFYDPDTKIFVGLGHGICDIDTGELLPLRHGEIVGATINGITKGERGTPGELRGYFNNKDIGQLYANVNSGVYGHLKNFSPNQEKLVIAMKQQVVSGPAKIISTISGCEQKYYDIEIKEVNYNEDNPTKNMIIQITDETLLRETGGIVQGMSGSPIIQNGMIVGAVTHVFVNDPAKGYAIFAENMLDEIIEEKLAG